MATLPGDVCAFCQNGEENSTTRKLQKTPDGSIVAHYNCMVYSPMAIMTNSEEDIEGFEFDITSVKREIKRGKKTRCNFCRKNGATVGCNVKSCRRTYHYPCVKKAKGSTSPPPQYVVYCKDCKNENASNGPNDIKETLLSTSDQNMNLDIKPEESAIAPKVNAVFSLSGFPKRNKDSTSNKQFNEKLEEVLQTMSSQEKEAISQIYSDLGGSRQLFHIESDATQDNKNMDNIEENVWTVSQEPTSMEKAAEEMSSKVLVPVDEEIENEEGPQYETDLQPQTSIRSVSEHLKMETTSNDFQSTNIQSCEDVDDDIFAKCLLQFLRKLPEDEKLVAKGNILKYILSL